MSSFRKEESRKYLGLGPLYIPETLDRVSGVYLVLEDLSSKGQKISNRKYVVVALPEIWTKKNLKNSALSIQGRIFQKICSYLGQCDDFIFSF